MTMQYLDLPDGAGGHRRLWRQKPFAEAYPGLVPSYDALRKQIQNRDRNGMAKAGACVPSFYGFLIDLAKYQDWIFQRQGERTPPAAGL